MLYVVCCMILLHTTFYKHTGGILRARPARSAVAYLAGGFRSHTRAVEAFFGGRTAQPPAVGVIVCPGRAPAALGPVSTLASLAISGDARSRGNRLTLEGRPLFLAFNLRPFVLRCGRIEAQTAGLPPFLLTAFCGRRVAEALDLGGSGGAAPGGGVGRSAPLGGPR